MDKKKKNTGTPYEIVTQGIWQAINNQREVATVIVQHDVTLQGLLTSHQIDVYWEFEYTGVIYKTVVQAKDWASPVKQEQLLTFKKVLDDLPGQPRGIFVTRTGYQEGALQVAKATGIELYELQPLDGDADVSRISLIVGDWANARPEIRSFTVPDGKGGKRDELVLGMNWTIYHPALSNSRIELDKKWFAENPLCQGIDKSQISIGNKPFSEVHLYDKSGSQGTTLQQVINDEVALMRADQVETKHVLHTFQTDTFVKPDSPGIPAIKINSISFDVVIEKTEKPARFVLKDFVQFVLRRISDGTEHHFIAPKS
jgi:hypothetical protein